MTNEDDDFMGQIKIGDEQKNNILKILSNLYGEDRAETVFHELLALIEAHQSRDKSSSVTSWLNEEDIFLITYGDTIRSGSEKTLKTLHRFLSEYLTGVMNYIHILPFYPYSSDDGFSILDYFKVNPDFGDWKDIQAIAENFNLMFDAVINHISAQSDWFQGYLKGERIYKDYFIEAEDSSDLSLVTRPRTLPLLTEFKTTHGIKKIWTTFSEDQVDLNYQNERVLLKIITLLLFYIEQGAKALRLDAIGYLWKQLGTCCIHLKQTHQVIQLFRIVLDLVAPETLIITETNVPHQENISYFGSGYNEAQLVYQFPLPPLVLHALLNGDASYLLAWAETLQLNSERTTFFNFLASHDGIGVMPVKDILPDEAIKNMVEHVEMQNGFVSYKNNPDGSQSAYELNINYFDALNKEGDSDSLHLDRFICSQAILLSIIGVPAIYIHSLLGSQNDLEGVKVSGRYRSINREKLDYMTLVTSLQNASSLRYKIYARYKRLISIRKKESAFHPNALQQVIDLNKHVFSFVRKNEKTAEFMIALHNVSSEIQTVTLRLKDYRLNDQLILVDLLSEQELVVKEGCCIVRLAPYQVIWLRDNNVKEL